MIRSAAVRIAATTLLAFKPGLRVSSLQGNRTFREFRRGQDCTETGCICYTLQVITPATT